MEVLNALNINGTFIAQLISFLLLVWLLKAVAYKPLLKALDERKQLIDDSIGKAENELEEAKKYRSETEASLKKARDEAAEILNVAQKNSDAKAQEILAAAQSEAQVIREKAVADIRMEKEKAMAELREHVVTLSLLAAGKIIEQKLDEKSHHQLVDDVIKEVGNLPC